MEIGQSLTVNDIPNEHCFILLVICLNLKVYRHRAIRDGGVVHFGGTETVAIDEREKAVDRGHIQ